MPNRELSLQRVREFDRLIDRIEVERLLIELQDFGRAHDSRMPPGQDICEAYLENLQQQCLQYSGQILVAEINGILSGYVCVLCSAPAADPADGVSIEARVVDLIVAPKARGLGIGRLLLNEAERRAIEAGAKWLRVAVFAWNKAALSMYESMGYSAHEITLERQLVSHALN